MTIVTKEIPQKKFADLDGDIILMYEANSLGREVENLNPTSYNKCLEEIIGDRVYIRPIIETRWTNRSLWIDGKPKKSGRDRYMFDGGVEWIVGFNKEGTYRISY